MSTTTEEKTFQLKTSDIVSGLIYAGIEMLQSKPFKLMTTLEGTLYNVLGRTLNNKTDLLDLNSEFVSNDNLYGALLSVADSKLRQNQDWKNAVIDGVKVVASSVIGEKALTMTKMEDKILFSV